MRGTGLRRGWLGVLCMSVALGLALPVSAQAAAGDPLFFFIPEPESLGPPTPPPTGHLNGPCGIAVDSGGVFFVSDYYHRVIDSFSPAPPTQHLYTGQSDAPDPLDGPCALAFSSTNSLYVNTFHRSVSGPGLLDSAEPTGVAVDTSTNHVYVNDRTYVAVYDSSGNPVLDGGLPLKLGLGSLQDAYGIAVSQFPGTAGRVYVPDAGSDTVKVYDPAGPDKANPVQTIAGPGAGFNSLRDSAIAVDRVTGNVYVADNLQPQYTEEPEAAIDVFSSTGSFLGRLKYRIVDALPPGLAVDNSTTATQGRVYVTSGNTDQAGVYAYGPGSAVASALPSTQTLSLSASGVGAGRVSSDLGALQCAGSCDAQIRSGAELTLSASPDPGSTFVGFSGAGCGAGATCTLAMDEAKSVSAEFRALPSTPSTTSGSSAGAGAKAASVAQQGTLRLTVAGKLAPQKLPRQGAAPIAVSVGWKIATTDASAPPKLKTLGIEINRHGHFDSTGLPTCPYPKIQPATSQRALANCRQALVGQGSFEAEVSLGTQEPYATRGRLLVFNGFSNGKPVLFGQIYSPHPFATSFVIVFAVKKLDKGTYGTALTAKLPPALASWGNLTGIQMRLARRYSYEGHSHSFISAACPAPKGFSKAIFPLARASFDFQGGAGLASTFTSTCQARG